MPGPGDSEGQASWGVVLRGTVRAGATVGRHPEVCMPVESSAAGLLALSCQDRHGHRRAGRTWLPAGFGDRPSWRAPCPRPAAPARGRAAVRPGPAPLRQRQAPCTLPLPRVPAAPGPGSRAGCRGRRSWSASWAAISRAGSALIRVPPWANAGHSPAGRPQRASRPGRRPAASSSPLADSARRASISLTLPARPRVAAAACSRAGSTVVPGASSEDSTRMGTIK